MPLSQATKRLLSFLFLAVVISTTFSACEDDDKYDYDPPQGKGAMYIDNNTGDNLEVFIDGQQVTGISRGKRRHYDLDPGVHRVVLDERHGHSHFRDDVDILEGRLTVLDVTYDFDDVDSYDVFIKFER